MTRLVSRAAIVALAIGLTACAAPPQRVIPLSSTTLQSQGRIGVVMTEVPKPDMSLPGAGCLLCYAAAAMANSSLSTHTKTLPSDDITKLKTEIANALTKKGRDAKVIDAPLNLETLPDFGTKGPDVALKDFSSLKAKYGVDRLLVIEFTSVGMERSYSAYIPNGPPMAVLDGKGYLVNLTSNTYEWYRPLRVVRSAEGAWDEPPKFPGLTNAYFQAVEMSKDAVLKPIAAGGE